VPDADLALIVGASGGIGAAIARRLGRDGYHVVLHSRVGSLPGLSDELQAAGIASSEVAADITEEAQVEHMFNRLPTGTLRVVVNSAGSYPARKFLATRVEDWDRVLGLNVFGPFLCIRSAARLMSQEGGSIVNIASISAHRAAADQAPYASSKAALLALTRSAAVALGPLDIRVNAVSPGLVWRDGLDQQWPEGLTSWNQRAPFGKPVRASEVAEACAFLASPAASGITGEEITVDGGIRIVPDY
jgi:NAD(P)-dependent dehydrogenase (short-subunit alcohol dehydrogenase family)